MLSVRCHLPAHLLLLAGSSLTRVSIQEATKADLAQQTKSPIHARGLQVASWGLTVQAGQTGFPVQSGLVLRPF